VRPRGLRGHEWRAIQRARVFERARRWQDAGAFRRAFVGISRLSRWLAAAVFARAFLDVLQANTGVLSTPGLFAEIRDRMKQEEARDTKQAQAAGTRGAAGDQAAFNEVPDLKSIRSAGHEMGDFIFIPVVQKG
jgi:hypothetical protein